MDVKNEFEKALFINKLAYNLEKNNPSLGFFEVNKLVAEEVERLAYEPKEEWIKKLYEAYGPKTRLKLIQGGKI